MAGTNTVVYLAVGDTVTNSGDGTPSSGDYIQLNDSVNYFALMQGFDLAKLTDPFAGNQSAGAPQKTHPLRAMASRTITMKLMVKSTTGGVGPSPLFKAINYKLKQARDASGALGRGTNVCLLLKFNPSPTYVAWDVLDGRLYYQDQGLNNGSYQYAELELDILPYARSTAQTWPQDGNGAHKYFTGNLHNGTFSNGFSFPKGSMFFIGNQNRGVQTYNSTMDVTTASLFPSNPASFTPILGPFQPTTLQAAWTNNSGTSVTAVTAMPVSTYTTTNAVRASVSINVAAGTYQYGVVQFQTTPFSDAGSWGGTTTVGYGVLVIGSNLTSYSTQVAVFRVNAQNGTVTQVLAPTTLGSAARTGSNTPVTAWGTINIPGSGAVAGDYFIFEVGITVIFSGASGAATVTVAYGGSVPPVSDNATLGSLGGTVQAFITPAFSIALWNAFQPGPIGGSLGALAQIHLSDTSGGGAPSFNRVRIARRSGLKYVTSTGYTGPDGAGLVDFIPVLNSQTATGSSTYVSGTIGTGGTCATDYIVSPALTNNTWTDLTRFHSDQDYLGNNSGSSPAFQQGIYDVWARVAEANVFPTTPPVGNFFGTYGPANGELPAGQYNVRLSGIDGSGNVSQPTPISTIALTYPNNPDIFADGFESGDSSQWLEMTNVGSGFNFQDITVTTAAAMAGDYGLHVRFQNDQPTTGTVVPAQIMAMRPFNTPAAGTVTANFLIQINQIGGSGFTVLAALGSTGATIAPNGTQNLHNDFVVAFAYTNGSFVMISHAGGGAGGYVYTTIGTTIPRGIPIMIQLTAPATLAASTTYTSTITMNNTVVATQSTANPGALAIPLNRFYLGANSPNLVASMDCYFDEASLTQSTNSAPNFGLTIVWSLIASQITRVWLQRDNGSWGYQDVAAGTSITFWGGQALTRGDPPAVATMSPANFRALISVNGSGTVANRITTTPVPANLDGTRWHMVNLGTLTLPPISQFEGLNPIGGSGNGAFSWRLDLQGQSNSGATTNHLYADAIWLLPNDEPQIVAEYPGLQNTTAAEWVIDTRRDGRSGALLRDVTTQNQIATANTIGNMLLAPGSQWLIFLIEGQNGVHYASSTTYGLQLRWQPLWDYVIDSGSF